MSKLGKLKDELGMLDELNNEVDELLSWRMSWFKLDELKDELGKLDELMDELDELLG